MNHISLVYIIYIGTNLPGQRLLHTKDCAKPQEASGVGRIPT